MTTEAQDALPGPHGPLPGVLVIEWPASAGVPYTLPAWAELSLYQLDMDCAEQLLAGAVSLTLRAGAAEVVTADVETLLGEDGKPLAAGTLDAAKGEDGEYVTAVFRYAVTAMRVTDARPRR